MNHNTKELGMGKISKLLWKQSTPAIIGMVFLSLYNLVDTIFIGRGVGALGIAGVAITWPLSMMVMALAQTIGIGAASIISRSLGAKKYDKASKTLGNLFSLSIIIGVIATILGMIYLNPILRLFGTTDTIMPFAHDYLFIILIGTLPQIFTMASNNVIRSEGNAKFSMTIIVSGAILNMALDAILIFGFNMGIKGAAWATTSSYFLSFALALYYYLRGKSSIKVKLSDFILDFKIIKEKFAIGLSSLGRMSAGSVMTIILNNKLAIYGGDLAIAAFGIINRLLMFLLMPVFGLVQGMQPILGYNYGAKKYRRSKAVIYLAAKVSTVMFSIAFVILMLFTKFFMQIFTEDTSLINMAVPATRILVLMLPLIGYQVIAAGMYQSMGKATKAFILSIMRQILFLIPLVLILPLFFGLDGIWYTFPLADLLAGIVTAIILYKEIKRHSHL